MDTKKINYADHLRTMSILCAHWATCVSGNLHMMERTVTGLKGVHVPVTEKNALNKL